MCRIISSRDLSSAGSAVSASVARTLALATVATAVLALAAACGGPSPDGASSAADTAGGSAPTPADSVGGGGAAAGIPAESARSSPGSTDTTTLVAADAGLQTPESVLYDARADVYLVSNINGNGFVKEDKGFVSRVSPDGKVLDLKWIDGARPEVTLHGPKGLALHGDSLFVADIDTVRIFDRTTGKPLGGLGVPGASFLNDLATGPDGTLYATDTGIRMSKETTGELEPTGTDALYRFGGGRPVALAKGGELGRPNGVAVDAAGPVICTFGSGKVLRVGRDGAVTEIQAAGAGQLDGLLLLEDGSLVVSSWERRSVYRFWPEGEREGERQDLGTGIQSPADIGWDSKRRRVLVPSFQQNRIVALSLGS